MNTRGLLIFCILALVLHTCLAQTPPQPATLLPDTAITQIRSSVTFLRLTCRQGNQEFDVRGTGFFVGYPEPRLGANAEFTYLVTNRHVAMCWNDNSGLPMQVERISIRLNRRVSVNGVFAQDVLLNPSGNATWILPPDDSIDLAVLPIPSDFSTFNLKVLPVSMLTDQNLLAQRRVTEGETVFFAGFFYQFPGVHRMEPIVRQGIIAMMPDDKIPFVGKSLRVYLADMHVFGGNSGSPAFINLGGIHEGTLYGGEDLRLFGVVNGNLSEDENFNLQLTTTLQGHAIANSGISTIVPASELKELLEDSRLQKLRDDVVKTQGTPK